MKKQKRQTKKTNAIKRSGNNLRTSMGIAGGKTQKRNCPGVIGQNLFEVRGNENRHANSKNF